MHLAAGIRSTPESCWSRQTGVELVVVAVVVLVAVVETLVGAERVVDSKETVVVVVVGEFACLVGLDLALSSWNDWPFRLGVGRGFARKARG